MFIKSTIHKINDFQPVHHKAFKTCSTWLLSQGHWPLFNWQVKKWQQPTQQPSAVNESKLYLFFCQISKIYIHIFWVCRRIVYVCHEVKNVENRCMRWNDIPHTTGKYVPHIKKCSYSEYIKRFHKLGQAISHRPSLAYFLFLKIRFYFYQVL